MTRPTALLLENSGTFLAGLNDHISPLTRSVQQAVARSRRGREVLSLAALLALLLTAPTARAATNYISDFAQSSGKYLVVSKQLSVHAEDTLLVQPGLNLVFAPLTGITVAGVLRIQGTKESPVYLSSIADTAGTATPFDWNGIELAQGGSAQLSFCYLAHATSALTVPDSLSLSLTECIFSDNGQWSLSVAGVIHDIPLLKPYSFELPKPEASASNISSDVLDTARVGESSDSLPPLSSNNSQRRPQLRANIIFGAVGLVLAGAGAYSLYRGGQSRDEYDAYVPGNNAFDNATASERESHYDDLKSETNMCRSIGWSCIGLALADGIFLTWRIAF